MRQFIQDKAREAGLPTFGEKGFNELFNELEVKVDELSTEAEKRAAKVKNISLRLLSVTSPQEVLQMFEDEFITVDRTETTDDSNLATIEELFMFLYFFKSQIGNMDEAEARKLIRKDYRVNQLVQMIFDKYEPQDVEFAYQVTSVLSLTILSKFYGLTLSSDHKDKLVDGLYLVNG